MRIGSQSIDSTVIKSEVMISSSTESKMAHAPKSETQLSEISTKKNSTQTNVGLENITKEKLEQAVDSINEFLEVSHTSSKFVLHDGLDKYYVRLVDAKTEEVIKEIPPERLLDAFYEMQKLAGMIVDEKI